MTLPYCPVIRLSPGLVALLLTAAFAAGSRADPVPAPPPSLSPIDQLTAPIALYPDPLIALMLPAATVPSVLAKAASYLSGGGDPSRVDVQLWDSSVRSLAHYPNVLEWMAANPDWTAALGAAFANSPASVMDSIQRLRGTAKASGALQDTPQQDVVDEDGSIAIEPADPDVIYVPSYDPAVVYAGDPYSGYNGPFLTFGDGYPVGFWLAFQLDWGRRAIWSGDWRNWHNERGWGHPVFPGQHGYINAGTAREWSAARTPPQAHYSPAQQAAVAQPRGMPGAPPPPEPRHFSRPPTGETVIHQNPPAGWQNRQPEVGAHPKFAPDQHSKPAAPSQKPASQKSKDQTQDHPPK